MLLVGAILTILGVALALTNYLIDAEIPARLFDVISARPAAERANALKDKNTFKTEMDEDAKRHMFPQNASLAA